MISKRRSPQMGSKEGKSGGTALELIEGAEWRRLCEEATKDPFLEDPQTWKHQFDPLASSVLVLWVW